MNYSNMICKLVTKTFLSRTSTIAVLRQTYLSQHASFYCSTIARMYLCSCKWACLPWLLAHFHVFNKFLDMLDDLRRFPMRFRNACFTCL